ncbi:MAG TPA: hypothetical protein VJT67_13325 [Longimicrobiaceae bacterium]|nr:hypothetical protein [Longimicrobiaceae bacterium]
MKAYGSYPAAPRSEVEWEELLVRYELGPRAFRVALEDLDEGPAVQPVGDALRALVMHELRAATLFLAMREGRPMEVQPGVAMVSPDPHEVHAQYEELRARNFAGVQRRGIRVWKWRTDAPLFGPVTAYQLILASTAFDGEMLAAVRRALSEAAC